MTGSAGRLPQLGRERLRSDLRDQFCQWIDARIGGIEAVLVGEQQEQVRFDQVGYLGGQVVVVAETDLFGGDGVVLIDDRDDIVLEERFEGVAGVQKAAPVGQIGTGQQHLGDMDAVNGEVLFI